MDLILILIALAFLVVIVAKPFFNKINIPLNFSAMFIGMVLGLFPIWQETASSESFTWLANLGMLFMIFSILFQVKKSHDEKEKGFGKYLIRSSIIIIGLELLIIFPLVYFFLEKSILSALLISLIFTTVAEAMVIPFLQKFKIENTKLGKSIIGIGVLDDVLEFIVILVASFASINGNASVQTVLITLGIAVAAFLFIHYFSKIKYLKEVITHLNPGGMFLLAVGTLFLFAGVFSLIELDFLGAVIAALLMKNLVNDLPREHNDSLKKIIDACSEGLFGPIFFLWVGITTSLAYLVQKPLLALLFVIIGLFAKIVPSIIATKKDLNLRSSIILGVALKFGSGIIFIKLLFEKAMISELTYTLTIAVILLYRILVPLILGFLIKKWKKYIV